MCYFQFPFYDYLKLTGTLTDGHLMTSDQSELFFFFKDENPKMVWAQSDLSLHQ